MTVSLVFTANLTYLADMDIIIASANVGNKQATTYRHHFWQLSPHIGHCFPSSVLYSFLATISLEFVSHHFWQLPLEYVSPRLSPHVCQSLLVLANSIPEGM